jgi:hypothetical protein
MNKVNDSLSELKVGMAGWKGIGRRMEKEAKI